MKNFQKIYVEKNWQVLKQYLAKKKCSILNDIFINDNVDREEEERHIGYSLKLPLGMYTLPDGVRTKHEGSKSSFGLATTKRPLFMRLIVGFLGGTSGGAEGGTPSRRKPVMRTKKNINLPKSR